MNQDVFDLTFDCKSPFVVQISYDILITKFVENFELKFFELKLPEELSR